MSGADDIMEELDYIDDTLSLAKEHCLELEVIWSALRAMKDIPSLSIKEAMEIGFNEWVK